MTEDQALAKLDLSEQEAQIEEADRQKMEASAYLRRHFDSDADFLAYLEAEAEVCAESRFYKMLCDN